jgi:hypothetical protein
MLYFILYASTLTTECIGDLDLTFGKRSSRIIFESLLIIEVSSIF